MLFKACGVSTNLPWAIGTMYSHTRARVVMLDGNRENLDMEGVLDGESFLFIIVLDYAVREAVYGKKEDLDFTVAPRRWRRYPTVVLTDLEDADDIGLISDHVRQHKSS